MKRLIFSLVMLCVGGMYAQDIRGPIANPAPGVLDGVYVKEHIPTKKVVPYEFVREADVTWSKRVWSVIDLREKFNHSILNWKNFLTEAPRFLLNFLKI